MSLHIHAIGLAAPQHAIAQADAARVAQTLCVSSKTQQQVLAKLYRRAGVKVRRSVILTGSTNGVPAQQTFYSAAAHEGDLGPTTAERIGPLRTVGRRACRFGRSRGPREGAKRRLRALPIGHRLVHRFSFARR